MSYDLKNWVIINQNSYNGVGKLINVEADGNGHMIFEVRLLIMEGLKIQDENKTDFFHKTDIRELSKVYPKFEHITFDSEKEAIEYVNVRLFPKRAEVLEFIKLFPKFGHSVSVTGNNSILVVYSKGRVKLFIELFSFKITWFIRDDSNHTVLSNGSIRYDDADEYYLDYIRDLLNEFCDIEYEDSQPNVEEIIEEAEKLRRVQKMFEDEAKEQEQKEKTKAESPQKKDIRVYSTGANRDSDKGKPLLTYIPWDIMDRIANHYMIGARKYGDDNWRKGMPSTEIIQSLMRHLRAYFMGMDDEDHLSAMAFNINCLIYNEERMRDNPDVFDMPQWWHSKGFRNYEEPETIYTQGITVDYYMCPSCQSNITIGEDQCDCGQYLDWNTIINDADLWGKVNFTHKAKKNWKI